MGDFMDEYLIDLKKLGRRIKELRTSLNCTQEQFSSQIYISTSYLALIETGKRTASIDVLAQISHAFHVSIDYLLFGEEESPQAQNQRLFLSLCTQYPEEHVSNALSLAEFYLKNLS